MLTTIPTDKITRNPAQPRKHFDPVKLQELADSIVQHGLLQPITVRPAGDGFQIIAGERRFRAHELAGIAEVRAIVMEADDVTTFELAMVENVNREDMNPIEEAAGFDAIAQTGKTNDEIASMFGKSRTYIETRRYLLRLDPAIQDMVAKGQMGFQLGWRLAGLSVNGQFEVLRQGFATDREAIKFCEAIKARESEVALFDLADEQTVETARKVRGRLDRFDTAIGRAAQVLDSLADVPAGDLAALDPSELERLSAKLDLLAKQARETKRVVGRAQTLRTAAA